MSTMDESTRAGFRLLVAVAKADGVVDEREQRQLAVAFKRYPEELEAMLEEDIDVDAEIAKLPDQAARERVYRSCFALAYVDDRMAHDEVDILDRIWPDHPEESFVAEVFGEVKDTLLPGAIRPVADPAKRRDEVEHDTLKYSVIAAAIGATPVPVFGIVADIAVVAVQVKLVRDIGLYWGHEMDGAAAKSLVGSAAGGIGVRVAVNNLARFVPGWGMALAAGTSFASTYAIGRVADAYFAGGRELDEGAMRDLFAKAREEGSGVYARRKDDVDALKAKHSGTLDDLAAQMSEGTLSAPEFERAVVAELDADAETTAKR